jgi:hypothetical protein
MNRLGGDAVGLHVVLVDFGLSEGVLGTKDLTEFARERLVGAGTADFASTVAHSDVLGAEDVLGLGNGGCCDDGDHDSSDSESNSGELHCR